MRNKRKRRGRGLIAAGLVLMAAALLLAGWNFYDEYRAGAEAERVVSALLPDAEPGATPAATPPASTEPGATPTPTTQPDEMPTQAVDGYDYIGVLTIPALGLELPVMSTWGYARLRIAPCRYSGSAYESGFVIAAHNYSTHFGRLNGLAAGDSVTFTATDGSVFNYRVAEVLTLEPTAIEEMLDPAWDLSLFTCTLGGMTRVTVRCDRA